VAVHIFYDWEAKHKNLCLLLFPSIFMANLIGRVIILLQLAVLYTPNHVSVLVLVTLRSIFW
jgi:hypothetical protein